MFDYSRLRGKIAEKCRSANSFAEMMNLTPTTIGRKLGEKSYFAQDEIIKAAKILGIPLEQIPAYFFVITE